MFHQTMLNHIDGDLRWFKHIYCKQTWVKHGKTIYQWMFIEGWRCVCPKCVKKGSRLSRGVGGGGVFAWLCFAVGNRPQPFATARNEKWYGWADSECCKSDQKRSFLKKTKHVVLCGKHGMCDQVSNVMLCDMRNTFERSSGDYFNFLCRRST